MSSSNNLGISPVLLLAVSQSLTTTNTRDSSPSRSPTKLSVTKSVMDNNNRPTDRDMLEEMVKEQMKNHAERLSSSSEQSGLMEDNTESQMNGQKTVLHVTSKDTNVETVTSDIDMASVLTTLAEQNRLLQAPNQSSVFHVELNSLNNSKVNIPISLSSVPDVKNELKQITCASKIVSDPLLKKVPIESSTPTQSSAIENNTTFANETVAKVKKTYLNKENPKSDDSVAVSQYTVKSEPCYESDDQNEAVPTKLPRLDNEPESVLGGTETSNTALNSEVVKTLLKMRLAMQGAQSTPNINELVEEINQSLTQSSSEASTETMLNVLTSLAMQNNAGKLTIESEQEQSTEVNVKDLGEQNKFIISYDSETGAPQVQGIIVSDGVAQVIDQSGNRLLIQSSETLHEETVVQSTQGHEYMVSEAVTAVPGSSVTVYTDPNSTMAPRSPCPVCGDTISGFHYGIFTCESCKGFFKRTVQNKKNFLCHRQGECEINLENRKKCPACRFAKCLVMGMKLEAIRADRTRGGRSSYSGTPSTGDQKIKHDMCGPIIKKKTVPKLLRRSSAGGESSQGSTGSHLVAVLSNGDNMVASEVKPYVPQILTDIMNLESLLCDDDIPPEIAGDRLDMSDPSVFLTFLQLAELKLYKIVRWARNLPYFANISTDDQILLLQNCWCELLTLNMCWKSMQLHSEVIFLHGQSIDEEKAAVLGIDDMFRSILELIEHMRRLRLDQYECVAMKVIILICPDMKGLKDSDKLGEQQQRISGALETYTNTHYPLSPNKFGELVLRLSELSRISFVLKGHLVKWMPPNSTSCGLLFELLKGENMKDLG